MRGSNSSIVGLALLLVELREVAGFEESGNFDLRFVNVNAAPECIYKV